MGYRKSLLYISFTVDFIIYALENMLVSSKYHKRNLKNRFCRLSVTLTVFIVLKLGI